ncbi:TPA: hypothetical protein ACH3X1_001029 [Trebouxia sp. C0004]
MQSGFVSSWAKFVCRAAADKITNIWGLLPRYTSLIQPPVHIMQYLEYLVVTMQQLMGPLPVTDWSLEHQPSPIFHGFTWLLMAAGIAGVPSLASNKGAKEFIQHQESWWNQYTDCVNFSKRAQQSRRRFKFQVQTDGVSVSVLMFQPFPESSTQTNTAAPPPPGRKRNRQQQGSSRKRSFTANRQPTACKESVHVSTDMTVCLGAAADGRRLLASSTGCTRQACGLADLKAALLATPTAKVASSAQFLHHIRHRMQHTAAAQTHFGDRQHRQLRWRSFIKWQQACSAICKEISGGSSDTVVVYGDAKFSSSCCKGNPSTPTVSPQRKLGHCRQVYDTDKFCTSKLCCACKTWTACLSLF